MTGIEEMKKHFTNKHWSFDMNETSSPVESLSMIFTGKAKHNSDFSGLFAITFKL